MGFFYLVGEERLVKIFSTKILNSGNLSLVKYEYYSIWPTLWKICCVFAA